MILIQTKYDSQKMLINPLHLLVAQRNDTGNLLQQTKLSRAPPGHVAPEDNARLLHLVAPLVFLDKVDELMGRNIHFSKKKERKVIHLFTT